MPSKLTIFERIERLASEGMYISFNTESNSPNTPFLIEATVTGQVVLSVSSNDLEAGLLMVVNTMEEATVFEYVATNNRQGYILAKDVADAVLKITSNKSINAKDIIGVSKVTTVAPNYNTLFATLMVTS